MESCVDEIIIDFVRDNKCLYDKTDLNFKNISHKKEMWLKVSENFKNLYHVDISAEAIEKRWFSLRDMFVRENRKQKLPPSGSGYQPAKEWELYRHMMFSLPHIAHRRTKSSYIPLNQSMCSPSKTCSPKVNNLLPNKESSGPLRAKSTPTNSASREPQSRIASRTCPEEPEYCCACSGASVLHAPKRESTTTHV
ncbi:uncharacterized protein LOC113563429 [Ooceraea biroi]|nr:uncharacterized protein LOC113563429 [Ooceraea biroi]